MIGLEFSCAAIVLVFLVVRARRHPNPQVFLRRMALMSVAGWISEDTVIRAYGFYYYSPKWSLIIDHVPLMIILIWPVVIHSAWDLARHLAGRGPRTPWIAAGFVLADAWLIEPVAVKSGLWWWTEPGLFDVPPIGVLGWSIFAWFVVTLFERAEARQDHLPTELGLLVVPAVGSHLVLVGAWWAAFRWLNGTVPDLAGVSAAWLLSLGFTAWALRSRARRKVPFVEMLLRAPGAGFFFVLLALHGGDRMTLVAYALGFAPPYSALVDVVVVFGTSNATSSQRPTST